MAVEKLEIDKEYFLDETMTCKGIYKEYRSLNNGYGFKPTNNVPYGKDTNGLVYFVATHDSLKYYTLVEKHV